MCMCIIYFCALVTVVLGGDICQHLTWMAFGARQRLESRHPRPPTAREETQGSGGTGPTRSCASTLGPQGASLLGWGLLQTTCPAQMEPPPAKMRKLDSSEFARAAQLVHHACCQLSHHMRNASSF